MSRADTLSSKVNAYSVVGPETGVSSSKATVYIINGLPVGVGTSKATVYVLTGLPSGIGTSKATVYLVSGIADGVATTKGVAYAVVAPPATVPQPNIYIFTRNDRNCFEGLSAFYPSLECKKPYNIFKNLFGSFRSFLSN